MKIHNRKYLKDHRKALRNDLTPAEATLWKSLQSKRLHGRKFRRQHSIENYIVDFYCPSEKLAVELDGQGHFESPGYEADQIRDRHLNELGIKVVRIENEDVFQNLDGVLSKIASYFTTPDPF